MDYQRYIWEQGRYLAKCTNARLVINIKIGAYWRQQMLTKRPFSSYYVISGPLKTGVPGQMSTIPMGKDGSG